jgi:hypothetical protein
MHVTFDIFFSAAPLEITDEYRYRYMHGLSLMAAGHRLWHYLYRL